jgi:predicted Zn-ribbon and HTH transcriptional regulator
MAHYVCSSCNYKFSSFRKPLNCPYCGKAKTVNEEETAADLLREVGSMIEDGRV